ncbi:Uncharacterized protein GBIM_11163 [Gryllus bimaculatus]|nr:Uncharacterized protein GBIM_11163 [Gryllus bimaculatus]
MSDIAVLSEAERVQVVARRLDLAESEFNVLSYKERRLHFSGGFLGEHSLAEITVRRIHDDKSTTLHFFLKTKPVSSPPQLAVVEDTEAFIKEVCAVINIFGKFRSALNDHGKSMEWTCECYYTRPDLLVFDDLSKKGFRAFNLNDPMVYEHFALAMKALANLHSASIIYEERHPTQPHRLTDEYSDILKETFMSDEPGRPGIISVNVTIKTVCTLIDLIYSQERASRIKSKVQAVMNLIFKLQRPSERFRNVACHGDIKRENILYLHDGDTPIDVRLVDFQLIRYAPPANDIMCFLYLATDEEIRDKYSSQLMAIYHAHLSQNLRLHGLNPEKILPWKELEESCRVYKTLGILISIHYNPVILLKEQFISHVLKNPEEFERFANVDRSPVVTNGYRIDESYRRRVKKVIEEFVRECIEKDPEI